MAVPSSSSDSSSSGNKSGEDSKVAEKQQQQMILTRRPTLTSTLLRPSRFRVDNRGGIDADKVMAQGKTFDSLIRGKDLFSQRLPPEDDLHADRAVAAEAERLSHAAEGTLENAAMSVVAREKRPELEDEAAITAEIRERGMMSLSARGLMVPVRQGFGELAANDTALLPYASFKSLATQAAAYTASGTSKAEIAKGARVAYREMMADKERKGWEPGLGGRRRAGKLHPAKAAYLESLRSADLQRVRSTVAQGLEDIAEEFEEAQTLRKERNADILAEVDFTDNIPMGRLRSDVAKGTSPRLGEIAHEDIEADEALKTKRETAAREAAEEAQRVKRAREAGREKAQVPRVGVGTLATWPLHASGHLSTDTAVVGGKKLGGGGADAMVYKHYSVLDVIGDSKEAARIERERLAEKVRREAEEARRAAAGKKGRRGARGNNKPAAAFPTSPVIPLARSGLQAASKSRAAAIEAQQASKESMTSIGKLMMSRGHARAPAAKDDALPLITGGALETEDFVKRVRPLREFEVRAASTMEELEYGGVRDRIFDIHHGVKNPWDVAPALINWENIAGKDNI